MFAPALERFTSLVTPTMSKLKSSNKEFENDEALIMAHVNENLKEHEYDTDFQINAIQFVKLSEVVHITKITAPFKKGEVAETEVELRERQDY
jgi:hypothetical protein